MIDNDHDGVRLLKDRTSFDSITSYIKAHGKIVIICAAVVFVVTLSIVLSLGGGSKLKSYSTDEKFFPQNIALCELSTNGELSKLNWTCTNGVPTSDVCSWKGILCNRNGFVNDIDISPMQLKMTGSIPTSIGLLSSLTYLSLSSYPDYSEIGGPIPSSIGYLTSLEYLYLYRNKLTGSIPTAIGYLHELSILSLHRNSISGTMPTTLGFLSSLVSLSLSNNLISGTIPETLGNIMNIEKLYLWNNRLSGSLPASLCGKHLVDLETNGNANIVCYATCLSTVAIQYFGNIVPCT